MDDSTAYAADGAPPSGEIPAGARWRPGPAHSYTCCALALRHTNLRQQRFTRETRPGACSYCGSPLAFTAQWRETRRNHHGYGAAPYTYAPRYNEARPYYADTDTQSIRDGLRHGLAVAKAWRPQMYDWQGRR